MHYIINSGHSKEKQTKFSNQFIIQLLIKDFLFPWEILLNF